MTEQDIRNQLEEITNSFTQSGAFPKEKYIKSLTI